MQEPIIRQTFLQLLLQGIEISESEQQQLEAIALIAQTKSAVELVIGLSPDGKAFMTELTRLLGVYVAKLDPATQQQYVEAIQSQMNILGTHIAKQIESELTQDERTQLSENLKKLAAT